MKFAEIFQDYYNQTVGALSPTQAIKQANMVFRNKIDYKQISESVIYFKDGSFLRYTMKSGILFDN